MTTLTATIDFAAIPTYTYVQSRNNVWHRVIVTDGVMRSTERCNLDDARIRARSPFEAPDLAKRCKWCYRS